MKRNTNRAFGVGFGKLSGCLAAGLLLSGPAGASAAEKEHQPALPQAAALALEHAFPKAEIERVERDDESNGVLLEVKLEQAEKDVDVKISADGVIAEVEIEIAARALPREVAAVLALRKAEPEEIRREESFARIESGRLVTLATPEVTYSVELESGGKLELDARGTVLEEQPAGAAERHEDGDEEDGERED